MGSCRWAVVGGQLSVVSGQLSVGFVREGQHDRSQARSAWSDEENGAVPAGRLNGSWLRLEACLATITLSLRDKSHPPIKGPRIKLALMGARGQGG